MSLALVAVVLAIGAGAVVAVSTREAAAAAIGLAVALVASSLLADPLPSPVVLGVRFVAALLAAALIRWAAHGGPRQFSPLGWPAEALLATAAGVAGLGIGLGLATLATSFGGGPGASEGGGGEPIGDVAALTTMAITIAAGTSLLGIGAAPLVHGRPGVRRAVGRVLMVQAVLLLRVGLAGPPNLLEEIARAALLVAAAASGSALVRAAAVAHRVERDAAASAEVDGQGTEPEVSGPGQRPPRRTPVPR
jgi:hypothetical protein